MADLSRGLAIVVGGASGIGAACAGLLARRGRPVAIVDLSPPASAPAGLVGSAAADVRDANAVLDAFRALAAEHGAPTAVVHAAGMARVTPLRDIAPGEWNLVTAVNLGGTFSVVRATAETIDERGGAIVLISSVDARAPVAGLAHYCAAKAGLEALMRSAALEWGPRNIRCNAIAPGVVRTPLMEPQLADAGVERAFLDRIPLGRIGQPEDVAAAAAFLVSGEARWITGATIDVDGGMRLREHPPLLSLVSQEHT